MPCVAIAIQRRRGEESVGLSDIPVRLAFPIGAMTSSAVSPEDGFDLGDRVSILRASSLAPLILPAGPEQDDCRQGRKDRQTQDENG